MLTKFKQIDNPEGDPLSAFEPTGAYLGIWYKTFTPLLELQVSYNEKL